MAAEFVQMVYRSPLGSASAPLESPMEGWPARVAERLAGSAYGSPAVPVIGSGPGRDPTLRDLRRAVEEGLPVEALDRITGEICPDPDEALRLKHAVIPRTTLRRRSRLTLEEGERTERLALGPLSGAVGRAALPLV